MSLRERSKKEPERREITKSFVERYDFSLVRVDYHFRVTTDFLNGSKEDQVSLLTTDVIIPLIK